MKLKNILTILLLSTSIFARAQEVRVKLYGERQDNIIRLAWVPSVWPADMQGVMVKRRTGGGSWQNVTTKPVVPASFVGKDLSNVDQLDTEQQRLNTKFEKMVEGGKAKPISAKEYADNILTDPARISGISFVFAIDYDLMLLNGFGCTDRNIIVDKDYEYGLFPLISGKISSEPIANYYSAATDKPDFNLEVEPEVEAIGSNKSLRLHWRFDLQKFRGKQIKGFNIYQKVKGEKRIMLNKKIIWITSNKNPVDLNYLIDFPDQDVDFYAVPVSYFGTEGPGYKIAFHPAAFNITVPAAVLTYSMNNQNVVLTWQLDHGYDSLINAYKVMKKPVGKEYLESEVLTSNTRSFTEQMDDNGEKVRYKLIAVTGTGREVWSNEVNVTYLPANAVLPPENLNGKIINKDGVNYIRLTWDYPEPATNIEFRIFTEGPSGNLIWDSSYPKDLRSPFEIEVRRGMASLEKFAIQARTVDKRKSLLSNEIEILTPSRYLAPISITSLTLSNKDVKVAWKFSDDALDFAGFRIEVDEEIYLTEKEVTANLREYVIKGLPPGKHYINIIAVTQFGLEERASKRSIVIP